MAGSITPLHLVSPGIPQPDPAKTANTTINALSQDDFSGNGAVPIAADGTLEPPAS